MTPAAAPITKDLVLLGGGHAHLFVIEAFRMSPIPGVRLTVVTRDVVTPYSGMLPGTLAGHYSHDESNIDLRPLALAAGARLYHDEAVGLDRAAKQVLFTNRPPVAYDLLSIDIGSRPRVTDVPGAAEHATPLKPIDRLAGRWQSLVDRIKTGPLPCRLAMVGGGAAGVEVALAAHVRLRAELAAAGRDPAGIHVTLITKGALLASYPSKVARIFARVLSDRGITVHANRAVVRVEKGVLHLDGAPGTVPFDEALWATAAGTVPWLAVSGLDCSAEGFVRVDQTLRARNDASIFAAGDVADMVAHPRPKAGVFAVRQGPVLARNLREALAGRALERFVPQSRFLSIVSTGDRYAVASKGAFAVEGAWVWRWKDRLDRRFMERFRVKPMMAAATEDAHDPMRCGGCGAKVGSGVLTRVLARLAKDGLGTSADVVVGLDAPDDAAVLRPPAGKLLVQTVDFFRAFIEDPYLFGRIAAVHALGDLHAMGATPRSALAIATVPHGPDEKIEDSLYQMMSGALSVFRAEGVALVGGHSAEGGECALGFSLEGAAEEGALLRKSTLRAGDALILTKPIGTGVLFAADMRRLAKGRWIDSALASMQRSSREPAAIVMRHGATACTDVTGFGIAGHLLEMLKPAGLAADIELSAIPLFEGAEELAASGVRSTLFPANARAAGAFRLAGSGPRWDLLFDPQTAGGLLAAIPAERADACVLALRDAGETAAIIARVVPGVGDAEPLRIG